MLIIYISLLILIIIAVIGALAGLATPLFSIGAPYVTTPDARRQIVLEYAAINPEELVIDLGSGNGEFLISAAKRGARAIGYETNPWVNLFSRRRITQAGAKATVLWKNLWRADLTQADVVIVFLLPPLMKRLAAKLERELKPGARIVSIAWPLPGWQPTKSSEDVFLYQRQ